MRNAASTAGLLTLATLALLWIACGAARGGDPSAASRTSAQAGAGFFETILDFGSEPVEVPAGTTLSLRLLDTLSSHETNSDTGFTAEVTQGVIAFGIRFP